MPVVTNGSSTMREEKIIDSDELFSGLAEVVILHRGQPYRLRVTRQDKLILTK